VSVKIKKYLLSFWIYHFIILTLFAQGELSEQSRIFYRNERSIGALLNSNGYGVSGRYAKRINKSRCLLVCGGSTGLHKSGQFSTWSPGRYDYPEDDYEVNRLMSLAVTSQKKRPRIRDHSKGYAPASYGGTGTVQLTCGNCNIICWGDRVETAKNYKLLKNSGCVIQKENGELLVFPFEKAKEEFDKMDPKHKRLYYKDYKKKIRKRAEITQLMP